MVAGDKIEFKPSYSDNTREIRKIGSVKIEYGAYYFDNAEYLVVYDS